MGKDALQRRGVLRQVRRCAESSRPQRQRIGDETAKKRGGRMLAFVDLFLAVG